MWIPNQMLWFIIKNLTSTLELCSLCLVIRWATSPGCSKSKMAQISCRRFAVKSQVLCNTSHFNAYKGLFRLLMKGIFDAYGDKLIFELVTQVRTRNSRVFGGLNWRVKKSKRGFYLCDETLVHSYLSILV